MSQVENAKTKLKGSINRLQKVIQSRIDDLEIENSGLRTQIVQLKQEILQLKKIESAEKSFEFKGDEEVTLSELKKIAG